MQFHIHGQGVESWDLNYHRNIDLIQLCASHATSCYISYKTYISSHTRHTPPVWCVCSIAAVWTLQSVKSEMDQAIRVNICTAQMFRLTSSEPERELLSLLVASLCVNVKVSELRQ